MNYEITSYIEDVGNGDPIIVYSPETQAITLGTGFRSFESIRRAIEQEVDIDLDGVQFDVFGVDGHIEFESNR